jgi:photosystem II stability/assembly factor-like uncharacterized protein
MIRARHLLVLLAATACPAADLLDRPPEIAPLAAHSLLLDVATAGPRLVAVGERGHVLLSDDQGRSWRQSRGVPARTMLTAVCFTDARNGWAVGHDQTIMGTHDAGESWSRSHYDPASQQPLLDVRCADPQHGIAVGAYGSYLTSTDGGASWSGSKFAARPLPSAPKAADDGEIPPDYHLNRIVGGADGRLYIAAEAGQLYRSDDGGASWVTLPSPYNGSWFGLLPLDDAAVLAFGLRGNLFRSDDHGEHWRKLESGANAMLTDGLRLPGGEIVIVGLSGTVLRSADGEKFVAESLADRKGLAALILAPDGTLVAVGEGGARRLER